MPRLVTAVQPGRAALESESVSVLAIVDKLAVQQEPVARNTDIAEQQRNTAVGQELVVYKLRQEIALQQGVQQDLAVPDLAIVVIQLSTVLGPITAAVFQAVAQAPVVPPMAIAATHPPIARGRGRWTDYHRHRHRLMDLLKVRLLITMPQLSAPITHSVVRNVY